MADDTLGMTDGEEATGDGDPGGAKEPKSPHNFGAEDAGRTTFDQGRAGGMREPGGAVRTMVSGGAERWGS